MSSISNRYNPPIDMLGAHKMPRGHKKMPKSTGPLTAANTPHLSLTNPNKPTGPKPHTAAIDPNGAANLYSAGVSKGTKANQPGGSLPGPGLGPNAFGPNSGTDAQTTRPGGSLPDPGLGPNAFGPNSGTDAQATQPGGSLPDPGLGPNAFGPNSGTGAQTTRPGGALPDPGLGPKFFSPKAGLDAQTTRPGGALPDPDLGPGLFGLGSSADARKAAEGLVSATFIEPILKQMRESNDAPPPFGPSRAEKQFGALLDTRLADDIVHAANFPLVQKIADRLNPNPPQAPLASRIDLDA